MEAKDVSTLIFSAAAIYAVYRFIELPKEDRRHIINTFKERTGDLLDDADATVEKVQNYMGQFKSTQRGNWFDKIYLFRQMFRDLYGVPMPKRISLIQNVNQSV